MVPPSAGTFVFTCSSNQDGYYESTTNLTLSITDSNGGGGSGGTTVNLGIMADYIRVNSHEGRKINVVTRDPILTMSREHQCQYVRFDPDVKTLLLDA